MIPAVCRRISTLFVSMMRRLECRYLAFHGISHPVFLVENMPLSCLSMNFLQCHFTSRFVSWNFAVLFAQSSRDFLTTRDRMVTRKIHVFSTFT